MATDILKKRMQRGVWFEAHSLQIVKLSLTLNILDWVFARFAGQLFRYKNYKWEEVGGGGGEIQFSEFVILVIIIIIIIKKKKRRERFLHSPRHKLLQKCM